MAHVPHQQTHHWESLLCAADRQVTNGIVEANNSIIGVTGVHSFGPVLIPTSMALLQKNGFTSFRLSLNGQGKVNSAKDSRSKPELSKMLSLPSARPSNWMALLTHCTPQEQTVSTHKSNANSNPTDAVIPPPDLS